MLVNKDFQTWHLIGWQHSRQPIRSHVRKSLFTCLLSNLQPWSLKPTVILAILVRPHLNMGMCPMCLQPVCINRQGRLIFCELPDIMNDVEKSLTDLSHPIRPWLIATRLIFILNYDAYFSCVAVMKSQTNLKHFSNHIICEKFCPSNVKLFSASLH